MQRSAEHRCLRLRSQCFPNPLRETLVVGLRHCFYQPEVIEVKAARHNPGLRIILRQSWTPSLSCLLDYRFFLFLPIQDRSPNKEIGCKRITWHYGLSSSFCITIGSGWTRSRITACLPVRCPASPRFALGYVLADKNWNKAVVYPIPNRCPGRTGAAFGFVFALPKRLVFR